MYLEFELLNRQKVEIEFTQNGANIFKNGHWSPLLPSTSLDFTFTNTAGYTITTWYGLELHMNGVTVHFRIPDFYINQVVGICGTNDFDKSDDFRLNDGTIIREDASGNGHGYRTTQELNCAQSWTIGKLKKHLTKLDFDIIV